MAQQHQQHQELDPKYDRYDFPSTILTPQKGYPGWTTSQEDAQVSQFRMMLEAEGYKDRLDTLTMLRFLRARKFDVKLAKQMFVECEKWRREFGGGVDNLTKNFEFKEKELVFDYYPQYYHKTDRDGRPIYIHSLGKIDISAMQNITSDERMLQNLVIEFEKLADPRLPACSRKAGYLLETCCTIIDVKDVAITSARSVMEYLYRVCVICQNYYPERLGKLYIVNTPWGFSPVFALIKRFLDPVTVAKVSVLGSDYESELLAQVHAGNLPKFLGGTCECEGGCMFSNSGPWRDPTYNQSARLESSQEHA